MIEGEGGGEVRGMVLAAGLGSRIQSAAGALPKPLVRVGGRALIDYAISNLAAAGIHRIVVNLHHRGQMIRDHLGDGASHNVEILYSEEDPLQGSGGGIVKARELLGRASFVTVNADTIIDIDLAAVLAAHHDKRAIATLVLRKDEDMARFGIIGIDGEDRVGAFLNAKRKHCGSPLEPFMYTGVQVLHPAIFRYMPDFGPFSITGLTYPALLEADQRVFGFRFAGPWLTVGTPEELKAARTRLRSASLDRTSGSGLS